MAYDGEIRIKTKVDTSQMQKLQVQIDKATNKVAALTAKYEELKNKKIPTDDYLEIQKQIDATQVRLDKLLAKKESFRGSHKSASWLNMNSEIEELQSSLPYLKGELQDLIDTGKAFTLGSDSDEFRKVSSELSLAQKELRALQTKQAEMVSKGGKISDGFKKIAEAGKKAFHSIQPEIKKSNGMLSTFTSRLKGILLSLFIFNWVTKAFNAMVSGIKEGFKNLVKYSDEYNQSVSGLVSVNTQMKNSFATAFAPIVQMVIPHLITLMNYITLASNKIAQFMAVISGSKTWIKATAVQEDYAASLGGTAAAAKKAMGVLASFDSIEVLNKKDTSVGSGGSGTKPEDMFEEVPVDPNAEKVISGLKDWLEKLKEAALPTIDAFKRLWEEGIGKLKDFSADTLKDFYNNFLVPVGKWVLGEGLPRFFNITNDLLNEIDWKRLQESLSGLYTALSGLAIIVLDGLLDFYEYFLKPLSVWFMSSALPQLLDILTELIEKVDWEKLNKSLEEFWKAIEPYAEQFGQGLIDFFSDLKDMGIAIINKIPGALDLLTSALNKGDPQKARNWGYALGQIAVGLLAVKTALGGFVIAKGLYGFFTKVKDFVKWIVGSNAVTKLGELGKSISNIGPSIQQAISGINPGAIGELGLILERMVIGTLFDTNTWKGLPKIVCNAINTAIDEIAMFIGDKLKDIGNYIIQGNVFLDAASACFENAKTAFQNYDWAELGMNIIEGMINGFAGTIWQFLKPIDDLFNMVWDWICEKFDMHGLSKQMELLGANIFMGIINGFTSMFSETGAVITEWFETYVRPWFSLEKWYELGQGILDGLLLKWAEFIAWWNETAIALWWEENVVPWFSVETWLELAQGIVDGISEKWTELSAWWGTNIVTWWNEQVAPWFTVEKWKQLGDNIKKGIYNGFCGILGKVESIINALITGFENMCNKIIDAINEIIREWNGMAGRLESFHIDTFSRLDMGRVKFDVPALANGAVLRGGNPFMAILGDQPSGQTNIETPLPTMLEAFNESLDSRRYAGNIPATFVINLNGEEWYRKTIPDLMSELDRQGYSIDILGGLT